MNIDFETTFTGSTHIDFQVIIDFANPRASASLFASDLRYTDADGERYVSIGEPADNAFLERALTREGLRGTTVRVSVSAETSEPTMEFRAAGMTIAALPLPEDEGWEARFDPSLTGWATFVLCGPGGRLDEFGPPR